MDVSSKERLGHLPEPQSPPTPKGANRPGSAQSGWDSAPTLSIRYRPRPFPQVLLKACESIAWAPDCLSDLVSDSSHTLHTPLSLLPQGSVLAVVPLGMLILRAFLWWPSCPPSPGCSPCTHCTRASFDVLCHLSECEVLTCLLSTCSSPVFPTWP